MLSKIQIIQKGAGNGKTYDLIQKLGNSNTYKYFIILVKQHSAKYIIKKEFDEQISQNQLHLTVESDVFIQKKHIICANHKIFIIATIDSFMYKLGNNRVDAKNKFEAITKSILNIPIHNIKFGDITINFNNQVLIAIDETQDLPDYYGISLIHILVNTGAHLYAIGDKLQSIETHNNTFNMFHNLNHPNIRVVRRRPINICRRFNSEIICRFVNKMIDFKFFGLPSIQVNNPTSSSGDVIIIRGRINKYNNNILEDETYKKIVELYEKEVEKNNRKPEDFLIVIADYIKHNHIVSQLDIWINTFWQKKYCRENINSYVHESSECQSIDLNESSDKTRIVSIQSAKGDGRPVVFVLGLSEKGLCRYNTFVGDQKYESLLHVALTRAKEKMIVHVDSPLVDDIYERIKNTKFHVIDTEKTGQLNDNPHININDMVNIGANDAHIFRLCKLLQTELIKKSSTNDIIDITYHNIRRDVLNFLTTIKIYNSKKVYDIDGNNIKKSACANLIRLKDIPIKRYDCKYHHNLHRLGDDGNYCSEQFNGLDKCTIMNKYFNECKKFSYGLPLKNEPTNHNIIVFNYAQNPQSLINTYYTIIIATIKNIQYKINQLLQSTKNKSNKYMLNLCPFECVAYAYATAKSQEYIRFMTVYYITEKFYNHYQHDHSNTKYKGKIHNFECKCDLLFPRNTNNNESVKIIRFIATINKFNGIIDDYFKKYQNEQYHDVEDFIQLIPYSLCDNQYKIRPKIKFVSTNPTEIRLIFIEPNINDINYYDKIGELLISYICFKSFQYICEYHKITDKKYATLFKNKKVICVLFTLEECKELYMDEIYKKNNKEIKSIVNELLYNCVRFNGIPQFNRRDISVLFNKEYLVCHNKLFKDKITEIINKSNNNYDIIDYESIVEMITPTEFKQMYIESVRTSVNTYINMLFPDDNLKNDKNYKNDNNDDNLKEYKDYNIDDNGIIIIDT